MNDIPNTEGMAVAETEVKHFYIDAEGNRIEIPSDGEAASEETAYITEDGADHVVI